MHKVAVIGDNDSIVGLKAVGFDVFPVESPSESPTVFQSVVKKEYAIIFITEELGEEILPLLEIYSDRPMPSVIFIPSNRGSTGAGIQKLRQTVERAVGADILYGKEGK